jgi:hypothetical protein
MRAGHTGIFSGRRASNMEIPASVVSLKFVYPLRMTECLLYESITHDTRLQYGIRYAEVDCAAASVVRASAGARGEDRPGRSA